MLFIKQAQTVLSAQMRTARNYSVLKMLSASLLSTLIEHQR